MRLVRSIYFILVAFFVFISLFICMVACKSEKVSEENKKLKTDSLLLDAQQHEDDEKKGVVKNLLINESAYGAFDDITINGDRFDAFVVNPLMDSIVFFHKNGKQVIGSFEELRKVKENALDGKKIIFAMNGGMFKKDLSPEGLYIENGVQLSELEMRTIEEPFTNFYSLPPNGVFYITDDKSARIITREAYQELPNKENIHFATQSAPLLVENGLINPELNPNSTSRYVRNGVGVTKNGKVIFGISEEPVRFYDFAKFFQQSGCENALYLDGFVSEMYLPEIGRVKSEKQFAIIIAVVK